MRLSNLEEGSYNNTPEPRKMQVTVADKKANTEAWKRFRAGDPRYEFKNPKSESVKEGLDNDDTRNIAIRCVDEMVKEGLIANDMDTDGDTEFQIQDIIHDQINKVLNVSEAEVQVDNAGNIAGYLNTIDEYAEQLFQIDEQSRPEDIKEMAYRIQNAVDDIRTRELGLKPSNIRSQYNEGKSPHKKGTAKYKKHMAAMHTEGTHSDAKPIYDLVGSLGAGKIKLADNPIFHNLVRFLDADTIEKFVADFRKNMDDGNPMEDEFKPHMMYDPKTGKGTHAKKEKDHLDMKDKGYTHDNPKTKKVEEDAKGRDESVKNIDEILVKMGADAPGDIIADIMHWIDAHPGENLENLIRQANGYYNDELGETKINEFGPDERYTKIGNNTMIANKKTGSVSSTLKIGGDKYATVNNHLNRDGSAGKMAASGTIGGMKMKATNQVNGKNPKLSVNGVNVPVNASKKPKVREAGSPWTTTGKHPEKMTPDELWDEIAVFDHIQDRGERLSPKDMMRLDSLFSYMDTAEMNEAIHRKADSMMESAVWKAKKNK